MTRVYRNSTYVLKDVLESMRDKKLLSEIERASRLSFDVAKTIVDELVKKKFVNVYEDKNRKGYQLSSLGLEFLNFLKIWCE